MGATPSCLHFRKVCDIMDKNKTARKEDDNGNKGCNTRASHEKRAFAGGACREAVCDKAGGVEVGNGGFPNLKIPPQNPRLHYFQTIQFWR